MDEHTEYISCIKDGVTGACRDIKDKGARDLIDKLNTALTDLQNTINGITGADTSHFVTVDALNKVIDDFNVIINNLDNTYATDSDITTLNSKLLELEQSIDTVTSAIRGLDITYATDEDVTKLNDKLFELEQVVSDLESNLLTSGSVETINAKLLELETIINAVDKGVTDLETTKADLTNTEQEITLKTLITNAIKFYNGNSTNTDNLQFKCKADGELTIDNFQSITFEGGKYLNPRIESNIPLILQSLEVTGILNFTALNYGAKKVLLDFFYPVDTIYETRNVNFNPNTAWGGTWERLPDGYVLQSASSGAGETIPAGLPNITGSFDTLGAWYDNNFATNGVFYHGSSSSSAGMEGGSGNDLRKVYFDASRSNSIYGKSNTVQPNAIKTCMWVRTA